MDKDTHVLTYADDITIYSTDYALQLTLDRVSESLEALADWLGSRGLRVSEFKTSAMIFSRIKDLDTNTEPQILFNNTSIPKVQNFRYLGVHLDPTLSWKTHIKETAQKAKKANSIITALAGIAWGAHPQTLLLVYRGLVRAILDWGCVFYSDGPGFLLDSIDRIQYAALRKVLCCISTTPTNTLLHLAGEPPLLYRRRFLMDKMILKKPLYQRQPAHNQIHGDG